MSTHGSCIHGIDRSADQCQRCEDRQRIAELEAENEKLLKMAAEYKADYLRWEAEK